MTLHFTLLVSFSLNVVTGDCTDRNTFPVILHFFLEASKNLFASAFDSLLSFKSFILFSTPTNLSKLYVSGLKHGVSTEQEQESESWSQVEPLVWPIIIKRQNSEKKHDNPMIRRLYNVFKSVAVHVCHQKEKRGW